MRLYRDLNITEKSAWFLAHRARKAFKSEGGLFQFEKEVEADESYLGGLEKNKHKYKNRGTDHIRAKVVKDTK